MTTLREDLAQKVESKDIERINDIYELFEDIKARVKKVIAQKTILRVSCQKEEDDLQQIEANIKLVKISIDILLTTTQNAPSNG